MDTNFEDDRYYSNKFLLDKVGHLDKDELKEQESRNKDTKKYRDQTDIDLRPVPRGVFNQDGILPDTTAYHKDEEKDKYKVDPYKEYLVDTGAVFTNERSRYKTRYIHIDSRYRNTKPRNTLQERFYLSVNPLRLTKDSSIIRVNQKSHPFQVNDRVSIQGVNAPARVLTSSAITFNPLDADGNKTTLLQISLNHYIPYANRSAVTIKVSIDGVKGTTSTTSISNISINQINKTHTAIFAPGNMPVPTETLIDILGFEVPATNDDGYHPNRLFVDIGEILDTTFSPSSYNITISMRAIAGIPLNLINADYPISSDQLSGYHLVTKVDTDWFNIDVGVTAVATNKNAGEGNIIIGQIKGIDQAYTLTNRYRINLGTTINNIVRARLLSSEFTNLSRNVQKDRTDVITWQDLDQGTNVFEIQLTPGKYSAEQLAEELSNVMSTKETTARGTAAGEYGFNVTINTHTDIVKFTSFKKNTLYQPFTSLDPPIPLNEDDDTGYTGKYTLSIEQTAHGLSTGYTITLSNCTDYYGIAGSSIDGTYTVTVVTEDLFTIELPTVQISSAREDTGGGNAVIINTPFKFRLDMSHENTIGKILGFRYPGQEDSITDYMLEISNQDPYQNELGVDVHGTETAITNKRLNLNGDTYFMMAIKEFKSVHSIGGIEDTFTKIRYKGEYGDIMYDTFVDSYETLFQPITSLSSLEFAFYDPEGNLVDFEDINHSFVMEFTTLNYIPGGTNINAKRGIIT